MMKKKIKAAHSFLSITIVILITAFFTLSPQIYAEDNVKISVSSSPSSLPVYYMQENSSINIKALIHKNRDIVLSRLIKGDVDMALLSTNEAAKLYNKGIDIKIAAVHTWGYFYIASTDKEINGWSDLKGKEIYVPDKGGPMDIVFNYLAEKNGLDIKNDIDQKRGKLREVSQLMINDMADTAFLREPFLSQVLYNNKKAEIVIDIQKEWENFSSYRFPQSSLVIRGEFIRSHPQFLSEFNKEYKKAVKWVNENNSASALLSEKYLYFPQEISKLSHPRLNLDYKSAQEVKETVKYYLSVLAEKNPDSIGGRVPDEEFYCREE